MSELLPKDLHVLSHNYYNVPGIKAVDKNGNTHTYTNLNREVLGIESNGIYTPPAGSAYETVAINVQDTSGGFDLTTWAGLGELAASGYAPYMLEVGGIINGTYTLTNGTVYDYPWIIVDFQDVELENGTVRKNVPILQAQYLGHESICFDDQEIKVATEETAQKEFYYIGYTSSTFTLLDLNTDDAIPYDSYTTIYKTLWQSVYPVRYGNSVWSLSYLRQYLNNSGSGFWAAQHSCDTANSNLISWNGFLTYMPSEMISEILPIKRTTTRPQYMGSIMDITYDKFWIASYREMNFDNSSYANDGEPFAYYKQILESDTLIGDTGTYPAMIRYRCDATSSANQWWTRSADKTYYPVGVFTATGYTHYATPYGTYYVLPCCALTGA